jgi:hypothetical protein
MIFSKWPMEMPPAMWIIKGWTKTLAIRSDLDSRLPGFRLLRFGFLGVGNQNRWPYAWIWTDLNMSKASVWHKLGITRAELHVLGGNSSFKKKFLTKASSSFCFYAKNMFNLTAGLRACVVHTVLVSRVFFCKPSPAPPGASAPCIGSVIFFPSLQWLRSCDINDVDWMCILCWADFGEATSRCGHARATVLRQEWSVCVTVKKILASKVLNSTPKIVCHIQELSEKATCSAIWGGFAGQRHSDAVWFWICRTWEAWCFAL